MKHLSVILILTLGSFGFGESKAARIVETVAGGYVGMVGLLPSPPSPFLNMQRWMAKEDSM